jgi:hypothetical protein
MKLFFGFLLMLLVTSCAEERIYRLENVYGTETLIGTLMHGQYYSIGDTVLIGKDLYVIDSIVATRPVLYLD